MLLAGVQDCALMRAARLALESGGDWLEIINADTDIGAKRRYNTEYGYDTQYVVQRSCGISGCSNRLVPVTVHTEYKTVDMRTIF